MSTLEVTNEGETLKIDIGDTTTASDVIGIINDKWPGCARLIERIASSTNTTVAEVSNSIEKLSTTKHDINFQKAITGLESLNAVIDEQKRKQKAIDRIAWKAENKQRFQRGMHWK